MEPNSATRPDYKQAAAATQSVIKAEDDYEDDDVYRSRPQLQQPAVLMRSLTELMKMLQAGAIDIDPEYQRDVVWTADRMTGLINSLMENFYIPPIILNKKPRPCSNASAPQEIYVCVDGKQRLSSVLAFIKGMIPCHDHQGERWWFCELQDSKRNRRVLSEQQQKDFFLKDFVAFEYNNLSPEQEEDLFARVQMGMQLNLAEKMRASTGPWQELARLFVDDFPTIFSLMKDRARSKDFQLALSCFSQIVECMHPTAANGVPTLKTSHTHLPKLLGNKGAVDDALKSHLASVWNTFKDLIDADPDTFTNANKYLRGVQTFAPVEMVAVTVLISMHSETRNNRLLLGDIQSMRSAVRESFVDLRLNATVWKWFWDYIENLEAIRGAIDGSTVNRNTKRRTKKSSAAPTGGVTAGSTVATITAAAAAPKRGRATARTKRPGATQVDGTSEEAPIAVKQEPIAASATAPPPLKRQRTENSLTTGLLDDGDAIWSSTYNTTNAHSAGTLESRTNTAHSLASIPKHASTQRPLPTARAPRQIAEQAHTAPPSAAPVPRQASGSPGQAELSASTPGLSKAHRKRLENVNIYVPASTSSIEALPNGLPEDRPHYLDVQSRMQVAPMLAGGSVLSSNHSMWQDGGSSQLEAPRASIPSGVPLPSSTQEARTRMTYATNGQHDEPIDLTSDTEQERAILLSAFKTKPVSSGAPRNALKPASKPFSQNRKPAQKESRISSQELPTRENNPYARYKRP